LTLKGTIHALFVVFGWALFVHWWNRVLPLTDSRDASIALVFIGLTVLFTSLATLLWVRYNIGIFRRKGPRKTLTLVEENRDADFLGRRIERSGQGSMKAARVVVVSVDGEVKTYAPDKR
jgi:hypothetical protein